MKRIISVSLMVMLVSGLLLVGFAEAETKTSPQYGGILKLRRAGSPRVLGYPPVINISVAWPINPCIERLFKENEGLSPLPNLATGWKLASDGKSIIITLRKGVKFHDGSDFNADAVKWNLDVRKAARWSDLGPLISIDVIDEHTLLLNLEHFSNVLLHGLTSLAGFMFSKSAFEKNGRKWAILNPVGTGPFKFVSYKKDVLLKYERFDDYWGGKPYLDGVEYHFILDPMTTVASFKAGEVDVALHLPPAEARGLEDEGYPTFAVLAFIEALAPDSKNPDSIFADKRVREALEYAIDKKAIADTFGYGYAEPINQMAASNSVLYRPGRKGRHYDPEKAKKLLAEAGYPNGFKTEIGFAPSRMGKNTMVAVQNYLGQVGIDVKLVAMDVGTYFSNWMRGWKTSTLLAGQLPAQAPNIFLNYYLSTERFYYSTKRPYRIDDLIAEAAKAIDFETHKALSQKVLDLVYEDAMVTPLNGSSTPCVINKSLHDHGINPPGSKDRTFIWTPEKAWLSK